MIGAGKGGQELDAGVEPVVDGAPCGDVPEGPS